MKYVQATNTGKGFITHADRAVGHMSGHGADIWAVSDNHTDWISRVSGVEKTLSEAENIVLLASQQGWDNNNATDETPEQKNERLGPRPVSVSLPV